MIRTAVVYPSLSQASGSSPHVLAALVPIFVLVAVFDIYCLADLFRSGPARHLPKPVWAVIILLVSSPIGGVLYLFLGRNRAGAVGRAR